MRAEALEAAIAADVAAGAIPTCVVATLGTTGVGAVDPLRAVGEVCRRHGVYLHVDAAWAGSALVLAEHRWMLDGVELADSVVFNPHKWMFTNFDCSAHFVRDPETLVRTSRCCRSTYATPQPSPAPSSTTGTGKCRSAGGSER
jgi:aromatic-L-amino-acid decarboxylase